MLLKSAVKYSLFFVRMHIFHTQTRYSYFSANFILEYSRVHSYVTESIAYIFQLNIMDTQEIEYRVSSANLFIKLLASFF